MKELPREDAGGLVPHFSVSFKRRRDGPLAFQLPGHATADSSQGSPKTRSKPWLYRAESTEEISQGPTKYRPVGIAHALFPTPLSQAPSFLPEEAACQPSSDRPAGDEPPTAAERGSPGRRVWSGAAAGLKVVPSVPRPRSQESWGRAAPPAVPTESSGARAQAGGWKVGANSCFLGMRGCGRVMDSF